MPTVLSVPITVTENLTPTLHDLMQTLNDQGKLKMRKRMAAHLETLLRGHVIRASKTRHLTANRLGAIPTNYLAKRADTVESFVTGNADGLIRLTIYGNIFARVSNPVTVAPRKRKWLTVPAVKETYGKRAGEIGGLRLAIWIGGTKLNPERRMALVTGGGEGKDPIIIQQKQTSYDDSAGTGRKVKADRAADARRSKRAPFRVMFWLIKGTTLPKDPELLPADAEFLSASEAAAREFLEDEIARAERQTAFKPPGNYGKPR